MSIGNVSSVSVVPRNNPATPPSIEAKALHLASGLLVIAGDQNLALKDEVNYLRDELGLPEKYNIPDDYDTSECCGKRLNCIC
ncbi:MAG: hypothetical protein PHV68_08260 [Candidatus Gastranaerophilales bacterium]|nr:hypothetical protein [Candidatus Gastranaerophilales bacterium]